MTVLSSHDIQRSIGYGGIGATRDGESLSIEPASMDVHLGNEIAYTNREKVVDVTDPDTYPEYNFCPVDNAHIMPGEFWLATTEEQITIPKSKVAFLHGRSSVGRLGLFIHNAGLIDPEFSGQITLELFNSESYPMRLKSGMKIAQVTFHDLRTAPDVGYSKHNGNKYDGQSGPTPSKLYEDFQ